MKKCCLLSYVHNEDFFFPIFMNYYSKIFDPADIYIISNNNTSEIFFDLHRQYGFQKIDFNTQYNHDFLVIHEEVNRQYQKLLKEYNGIYLVECDEILFHIDGLHNIVDLYMQVPGDAVRSIGYEPLHDYWAGEPAIDTSKPLLPQRKYWWDTHWYRKPVFIKRPIDYWYSMHRFYENHSFIDGKLMLIHLKCIDYEQLWQRNLKSVEEANVSPYAVTEKVGCHNRIPDREKFDEFFKLGFSKRELIPEYYKLIF